MLVKIIKGDGWYKHSVGDIVEVSEHTTMFRQFDGGERVPHYEFLEGEDIGGGLKKYHLIECSHAEIVK